MDLTWLKNFNNDYSGAVQALTPVIIGIVSFFYFQIYKESKSEEGDAALMLKPVFWSIGRKFKILAVHKYEISEDISGYRHAGQNSRPDQWSKLIRIESKYLNLRHEVIPVKKEDILTVIISRNGKEKWRTIDFNK